tara:strand:+ start:572 stop:1414 length:843 start_codon:yes stop_codon:yes gene_type:complete
MGEVWKKIEGWDEYSVSSYGNVKRDKKKSGEYLKLSKKQHEKQGVKYNYYTYWVCLSNNGYSKSFKVSRLVALAFIPNPDNLPVVHHIDKNPLNNNVDNLEWATNLENCQSVNTLREIGGVRITTTGYVADFIYYGKRYDFYNPDKDKCQDWLNARRVEIENNLNLTELECHNKYKGYLDRDPKSNSISARINYKTKTYSFTNPNREKCQDWLNARYVEIMNGLNLTELDIRKKGNGSIYLTKSKTYSAEIMIKGKLFRKTFKTREEGERFIEECKRNNT